MKRIAFTAVLLLAAASVASAEDCQVDGTAISDSLLLMQSTAGELIAAKGKLDVARTVSDQQTVAEQEAIIRSIHYNSVGYAAKAKAAAIAIKAIPGMCGIAVSDLDRVISHSDEVMKRSAEAISELGD